MKNWRKLTSIAVVMCMVLVLAACNSPAAEPPEPAPAPTQTPPAAPEGTASEFDGAPTFELKLSHAHPAGSGTDVGFNTLAEKIAEYTEGTVTATVYPGGSLIASNEAVEALRNGTLDVAHISSGDLATMIATLNLLDVPGSYVLTNDDAYYMEFGSVLREIIEPYGIQLLMPMPAVPSWFFSNKLNPRSPSDLQGLTVRSSGKYGGLAVEIWGGSPVTITLADLPTAMERNTVDVVMSPGLGAYSNSWYEIQHHLTVTEINTVMAMMAMSKQVFDQMTPAQQDALYRAAFDGCKAIFDFTMDEINFGMSVMSDYGNQIEELTPEENAVFKESLQPLRDQIVDEVGEEAAKLEAALQKIR